MSAFQDWLAEFNKQRQAFYERLTPAQRIGVAYEEKFQADMVLHGHAISPEGAHHIRNNDDGSTHIYDNGTDCPHCGAKDINNWWAKHDAS